MGKANATNKLSTAVVTMDVVAVVAAVDVTALVVDIAAVVEDRRGCPLSWWLLPPSCRMWEHPAMATF